MGYRSTGSRAAFLVLSSVALVSCGLPSVNEIFTGTSQSPSSSETGNMSEPDTFTSSSPGSPPDISWLVLDGAYEVEYVQQVGDQRMTVSGYLRLGEKKCAEDLTVVFSPEQPSSAVKKTVDSPEYQLVSQGEVSTWTDSRNSAGDTPFIFPTVSLLQGDSGRQGLCSLVSMSSLLSSSNNGTAYRWAEPAYSMYAKEGAESWIIAVLEDEGVDRKTAKKLAQQAVMEGAGEYSLMLDQLSPVEVAKAGDDIVVSAGEVTAAVWVKIVLTPVTPKKVSLPDKVIVFPDMSQSIIIRKLMSFEGVSSEEWEDYGVWLDSGSNSVLSSSPPYSPVPSSGSASSSDSEDIPFPDMGTLFPPDVPVFDNSSPEPSTPPAPPVEGQ